VSTKIHLAADSRARPLARVTSAGQRNDALGFEPVMHRVRIPRRGPGRPRTRPGRVLADKAYSSRSIRSHLRRRRIQAVIPEPADQIRHRKRRGSRGGRPVAFDTDAYRLRNTVERAVNKLRGYRAVATRYDCEDAVTVLDPGLTRATTGRRALCLICRPWAPGREVLPPDPAGVSR
jgi:Transposase DDE domain